MQGLPKFALSIALEFFATDGKGGEDVGELNGGAALRDAVSRCPRMLLDRAHLPSHLTPLLDPPIPVHLDHFAERALCRSGDREAVAQRAEGRQGLPSKAKSAHGRQVLERCKLGRMMLQSCARALGPVPAPPGLRTHQFPRNPSPQSLTHCLRLLST